MYIVCGGGGNDVIQGGNDNDTILGDAGLDILIGGGGTNLLNGGTENDTLLLGDNNGFGSSNFNFGGAGARDVCQPGRSGINALPECEVKLP
jgi:Ca2+-binding RTX toxin-like protein